MNKLEQRKTATWNTVEEAAVGVSGRALRYLNLQFPGMEMRNDGAIIRVTGPTGPFSFLCKFAVTSYNICSNCFLNIMDS